MLGRALELLPEAWSEGAKLAVVAGVIAVCFVSLVLLMAAAFGKKRASQAEAEAQPASGKPEARTLAVAPDLDPEEWVSGNVIHYDRHKAFGYIRCDRVKGHVRFQAADFRRAPRVGETVRFKGRHGARRKPVAVVVERLPGAKRAG
jgi:cold shock CspA family protein